MNVFSEIVKLRSEFAETSMFFSNPFEPPAGEPLKQYAEFVEQKAVVFKELLRRELVNKDKNSNSSPSGQPTSAKSCTIVSVTQMPPTCAECPCINNTACFKERGSVGCSARLWRHFF